MVSVDVKPNVSFVDVKPDVSYRATGTEPTLISTVIEGLRYSWCYDSPVTSVQVPVDSPCGDVTVYVKGINQTELVHSLFNFILFLSLFLLWPFQLYFIP